MDDELVKVRDIAIAAQKKADMIELAQKGHEDLCAIRYGSIDQKLGAFTRIFEKLDTMTKVVYMGVGIAVAIPVILEILRYLGK